MKKKFFSGDSVRQALLQAARYFEIDPEEVAYREVDRRHGFLRGRRRAVIEVDPENPRSAPAAAAEDATPAAAEDATPAAADDATPAAADDATPAAADDSTSAPPAEPTPEPEREEAPVPAERPAFGTINRGPETPLEEAPTEELPADLLAGEVASAEASAAAEEAPAEPDATDEPFETLAASPAPLAHRYPQAEGDLAEAAREALERLFDLGQLDLEADVLQGEERLEVELSGDDEELLLEDRGRLLLAIQHLLPRMLRGLTGQSTPCWVDCDNFHEIRMEQLRDLAQRVATEVRTKRRSRTLEPMSPDERRIVHLTLADDPAVETVSQGNGLFKRVQVRPLRARF